MGTVSSQIFIEAYFEREVKRRIDKFIQKPSEGMLNKIMEQGYSRHDAAELYRLRQREDKAREVVDSIILDMQRKRSAKVRDSHGDVVVAYPVFDGRKVLYFIEEDVMDLSYKVTRTLREEYGNARRAFARSKRHA